MYLTLKLAKIIDKSYNLLYERSGNMKMKGIINLIKSIFFRIIISFIFILLSKTVKYRMMFSIIALFILSIDIIIDLIRKKNVKYLFPIICASIILCLESYIKEAYIIMLIAALEKRIVKKIDKEYKEEKNQGVVNVLILILIIIGFIINKSNILYIISIILITMNNIVYSLIKKIYKNKLIHKLNDNKIYLKEDIDLKKVSKIKNIVLNKSGTLTSGKLRIIKVLTDNQNELFYYLNNVEANSTHRFKDIIMKYRKSKINLNKIEKFKEYDNGVEAFIDGKLVVAGNKYFMKKNNIEYEKAIEQGTIIYVAVDGRHIGTLVISDSIKNKQKVAIQMIKKLKIKNIFIISGDNEKVVKAVAHEYKIRGRHSNATKEEQKFWLNYQKKKKIGIFATVSNEHQNIGNDQDIKIEINHRDGDIMQNDITINNDDLCNIPITISKVKTYILNLKIINLIILLEKIILLLLTINKKITILCFIPLDILGIIIAIVILERGKIYERLRNRK